MKKNRHEKIIEIVEKHEVETQDELIEHLRKLGYEVTGTFKVMVVEQ